MESKKTCDHISDHTTKINDQTNHNLLQAKAQPKYLVYIKILCIPGIVFFKVYILKLRILKGYDGYYEAKSKAFERLLLYFKYIEALKVHHNRENRT
ncbi:hypothetical protein [Chryseobacterium camelliae]|uniref:hypothetical protein n=1 Tax=Chryseobacterium camelliae TaxID=1265445 RepID=UPI00285DE3B5|nr:hypothetical protein [Chryseobacterium camelliae]MDR6513829.1 hypothetical protein [Chryseobacterium camelliae]